MVDDDIPKKNVYRFNYFLFCVLYALVLSHRPLAVPGINNTLYRMIRLNYYLIHSRLDTGSNTGPVCKSNRSRPMAGYRVSIKKTLDIGALRKGCMSVNVRRVCYQGRGKTTPSNLSPSIFVSKRRRSRPSTISVTLVIFPLITSIRLHRRRRRRRHTNDDDLCKSQPVLNTLHSPTLADSSETFRNNSAPCARSCVSRPGSFLPFCAEPPRNNRFRRVTLANEARAIALELSWDAYCASEPGRDATDHVRYNTLN